MHKDGQDKQHTHRINQSLTICRGSRHRYDILQSARVQTQWQEYKWSRITFTLVFTYDWGSKQTDRLDKSNPNHIYQSLTVCWGSRYTDGQNEPESQDPFQVLHGHQTPEDGSCTERVAAARLDGLGIWGAAAEEVDEAGVEGEDGAAHVDVVLVILCGQVGEVIFTMNRKQDVY